MGRGRIPSAWFTQNCAYNSSYEIHRLNVHAEHGLEAVTDEADRFRQVRYNFIRDRPGIAAQVIAVRSELNMRMVMPAVVPHSPEQPFLGMQRAECGPNGNLHHHGFNFGGGNPRLDLMVEEVPEGARLQDVPDEVAREGVVGGELGPSASEAHGVEAVSSAR